MRGIKEKIAENLSYINPVSRRMLLGAVIVVPVFVLIRLLSYRR